MTDLAEIKIAVDTTSVIGAVGDLDRLAGAAASLDSAARNMNSAVGALATELARMRSNMQGASGEAGSLWETFSSFVDNADSVLGTIKKFAELPKTLSETVRAVKDIPSSLEGMFDLFGSLDGAVSAFIGKGPAVRGAVGGIAADIGGLATTTLPSLGAAAEGAAAGMGRLVALAFSNPYTALIASILLAVGALYAFRNETITVEGHSAKLKYFLLAMWEDISKFSSGVFKYISEYIKLGYREFIDTETAKLKGFVEIWNLIAKTAASKIDIIIRFFIGLSNAALASVNGFVEYFSQGFGKIARMTMALGRDIANALKGKLSVSEFLDSLDEPRIKLLDIAGDVRAAFTEGFNVNYAQSIADASSKVFGALVDSTIGKAREGLTNLAIHAEKLQKDAEARAPKPPSAGGGSGLGNQACSCPTAEQAAQAALAASRPPAVTKTTTTVTASLSGDGCDCGASKGQGCEDIVRACPEAAGVLQQTAAAAAKVAEAYEAAPEPISILTETAKESVGVIEGLVTTLPEFAAAAEELVPPSLNDQLKVFGSTAKEVGTLFTQVLGDAGKPFANAANGIAAMTEAYGAHAAKIKEINASTASDEAKRQQTQYATIDTYAKMAGAAKGFFKEGSTGYKAMEAAEKTFRAFQLAMQIRSMAMQAKELAAKLFGHTAAAAADTAETAVSAANSSTRTGFSLMAGAAKMFEQGGIAGFALVAAMLAVMASLGFGGRGGGSAPSFNLEDKQKAQGTGSVLGAGDQKSESLKNALDDALETQEKMAGYQNVMVSHLRSIDTKIGAFATSLVKQISGGKLLATKELNLGTSGRPATLGNLGFGNTTNRTLQDQGLTFSSASVAEIINKGISGSSYQDVLVNTVKKAFGITYSNKTSVQRSGGALPDDFGDQVKGIIASIRDGIIEAAGVLGLEGAEATIDAFQVSLGEISLKDMSGEEIQETLNAVFGKLADDMAAFVGGDLLDQYQKIGEGQFETMVRLANGLQVVRAQLESAGVAFNSVGVAAVNASQNMINAAGGLDAFVSGMEFFTQNFMTEAERMAITTERVTAAMAGLGLAGVTTIEQFKAAMQSALAIGDAVQVGKLMDVQKDFLDVAKYQEKMAEAQAQVAASAASAASSLSQVNDGFGDLIKNLKKFRDELLKGPAANLSPEEQYRIAAADFDRVSKLAASGDQQAQSELQTVSQALLTASKAYFASSQGYNDDFQRVLAVLDKIVGARPETLSILDRPTPGDMRPVSLDRTGGIYTTQKVANDNEEIADLLREVKDELRAANLQRGAVGEAQLKRLEKVCDQLDATKRELARA